MTRAVPKRDLAELDGVRFSSHSRWRQFATLTTMAVPAMLLLVAGSALSDAVSQGSGRAVRALTGPGSTKKLRPLVDMAVDRLLLGDAVAAAKFEAGLPVDDLVREQQLLDSVAAMAETLGIDPAMSVHFFQAQIDANKVVQRGLFMRWARHPALRPRTRPDLAREVRPRLDQITDEIMQQLKLTQHLHSDNSGCQPQFLASREVTEVRDELDSLHRKALAVALRPVCASNGPDLNFG